MVISPYEYWRTIEYIWYVREKGTSFNKEVKCSPYYCQALNLSSVLHHSHSRVKSLNLVKKFIEVCRKTLDTLITDEL